MVNKYLGKIYSSEDEGDGKTINTFIIKKEGVFGESEEFVTLEDYNKLLKIKEENINKFMENNKQLFDELARR